MKKIALIAMMALTGLTGFAQTEGEETAAAAQTAPAAVKFGYLSYDSVMTAMPQYARMQNDMADLRSKYEAEQKRVENDFNMKYEEFLDGQKNFPKTILEKRQSELQEMLDKNIAFKKKSQQLLAEAEAKQKGELCSKICEAVGRIGQERGYAFILNTDAKATPWLNPAMGEDITQDVKDALAGGN